MPSHFFSRLKKYHYTMENSTSPSKKSKEPGIKAILLDVYCLLSIKQKACLIPLSYCWWVSVNTTHQPGH